MSVSHKDYFSNLLKEFNLEQHLNPILWITNYFEGVINKIDVIVEQLTITYKDKPQNIEKLNLIRDCLITTVNSIKDNNLKNYKSNKDYFDKQLDSILSEYNAESRARFSELLDQIFVKFCFLIKLHPYNDVGSQFIDANNTGLFGYSIIYNDWYITENQLELLK